MMKVMSKKQYIGFLIFFCLRSWLIGVEANTVITSDRIETDSKNNIFNFYGNVHLEGEGVNGVCDQLEVVCRKGEGLSLNGANSFEKITAVGHVEIKQEGRTIRAGHALFFCEEGKVVLTENPEITDSEGTVKGEKITFYKNEGKAYVEGGGEGGRPKVVFATVPDLKGDKGSGVQKVEKRDSQALTPKRI